MCAWVHESLCCVGRAVAGVIPWIRRLNPKCRVAYRSHIEIRADMIREQPQGAQAEVPCVWVWVCALLDVDVRGNAGFCMCAMPHSSSLLCALCRGQAATVA